MLASTLLINLWVINFKFVCDCTLHFVAIIFFPKEELKFIDIISLIPRPHPAFVAALQASLIGGDLGMRL